MKRTTDTLAGERTLTDFEEAMNKGHRYWLGPIVRAHQIGEYQIIEYRHQNADNEPEPRKVTDKHEFSVFINGKSQCCGADSLDGALAQAIARKHDGCNTQAGFLFMKMIANGNAQ